MPLTIRVSLIICAVINLCACTIAPKFNNGGETASLNGNKADSGIICDYGTGKNFVAFVVDDFFVNDYNRLIGDYGGDYQIIDGKKVGLPHALKKGEGINPFPLEPNMLLLPPNFSALLRNATGTVHLVDKEHMAYYKSMQAFEDSNVPHQTFLRGVIQ
jgi:hypothetical protein